MKTGTFKFYLEAELPFLSDKILYGMHSNHEQRYFHRLRNRTTTSIKKGSVRH